MRVAGLLMMLLRHYFLFSLYFSFIADAAADYAMFYFRRYALFSFHYFSPFLSY